MEMLVESGRIQRKSGRLGSLQLLAARTKQTLETKMGPFVETEGTFPSSAMIGDAFPF